MYTPAKFLQVADLATGLAREWVVRHVDIPEGSKSLLAFRISLGHLHQDSEVLDLVLVKQQVPQFGHARERGEVSDRVLAEVKRGEVGQFLKVRELQFTSWNATWPRFTTMSGCRGRPQGKTFNPQGNVTLAGRQFTPLRLAVATGQE